MGAVKVGLKRVKEKDVQKASKTKTDTQVEVLGFGGFSLSFGVANLFE